MSYVDTILEPGEQITHRAYLHWIIYCPGVVLALIGGLLLVAFTVCAEPALAAGSYLNCQTKKAIIIDAPSGKSSLSTEENVGFWIDEAAKTITLEDGTPLIVRRFDDSWISAARGDESYEIDRRDSNLAYASSTAKDGVTTIIIGYGRCKLAASPAG